MLFHCHPKLPRKTNLSEPVCYLCCPQDTTLKHVFQNSFTRHNFHQQKHPPTRESNALLNGTKIMQLKLTGLHQHFFSPRKLSSDILRIASVTFIPSITIITVA
jgi:hypothetical protein